MKKFRDYLISALTGSKYKALQDETNLDAMLRLIILNIVYFIASVSIVSLGVTDMQRNNIDMGLIQLILGFMIFLNLFLLRTELPFLAGGFIVTAIYGVFCGISIFGKYEMQGLDVLWVFSYPLMSIYTLGLYAGLIPALVLFGVTIFGTFTTSFTKFNYSLSEAVLICGVYFFILIITAVYEYVRSMKDTEIMEAKKRTEQASQAKSNFLANMSHEIRTPLNAIIGMTNIAKGSDAPERKDYCLNKIESASAHLLGIINDVLDMSKIEENKFELSCSDFEFSAMVQRVVSFFEFSLDEKKQKLTVGLDPAIPTRIITDEQRLAQVITNLISNAIKFTPKAGDITLSIQRLAPEEEGFCVLEFKVIDTGIGITKENQEKLFQPFVQADSSITRRFGGTGLGLPISKKIVEMMQGKIQIESERNKGSTFSFTVRAEIPAFPLQIPDNKGESVPSELPDYSGKHILLVEDIEINREIVITVLEPLSLKIIEAEDGQKAYNSFCADPDSIDFIFMDIQMPGIDGYESARLIRSLDHPKAKTVPIVAMTANVFKEDIEHCLAAGMNDHIGKPLDFDAVIAVLRKYL